MARWHVRERPGHTLTTSGPKTVICPATQITRIALFLRLVKDFKELIGGCSRTRTYGPLIKSQLLYQLSYAPTARLV